MPIVAASMAAPLRDAAWAAPLLWRSELRNVLAVQLRARRLRLAHATEIQEVAEAIMSGREFQVDSARVRRGAPACFPPHRGRRPTRATTCIRATRDTR